MDKIKYSIARAIKESKWLDIDYLNLENKETRFWIAINDINDKSLYVSMAQPFKYTTIVDNTTISLDRIKKAKVIDFTTYEVPDKLINRLENKDASLEWLNYERFYNNVLMYLAECNKYDTDPYQSVYSMVSGIDVDVLKNEKNYTLNDEQYKEISQDISDCSKNHNSRITQELVLNALSIAIDKKLYVIAYYNIYFDVGKKRLQIKNDLQINKTFIIDNTRHSLSSYLDMDVDRFINGLKTDYNTYSEILRENLRPGELIDQKPYIMKLERNTPVDLYKLVEDLSYANENGQLLPPIKAFFGNSTTRNYGRKEPQIVLIDKNVNIDQVRVVYNSMKNAITYVQGPPGTGKTTTILNVILSSFFNDKRCLIVSNNNVPIKGIYEKINFKYLNKNIPFPILRIGDRIQTLEAIEKIKEIFSIDTSEIKYLPEAINKIKEKTKQNYSSLTELLKIYEEKHSLNEKIGILNKFIKYSTKFEDSKNIKTLTQELYLQKEKLNSYPEITNTDVLKHAIPAKDDHAYMQYLYYESYKYVKNLQKPKYDDLRQITKITDPDEKVLEFNRYIRDDEKLEKLLDVFPFIVSTNISANKLGSAKKHFDLCIMDEAGQCNIATSLIPISRSKTLLLVGDPKQLKPIINIEESLNNSLMEKYNVKPEYNYCDNSILTLMRSKDKVSKDILLRYHYRCAKKIIQYSNQKYYDNQLILDNAQDPSNQLEFIDVKNETNNLDRNAYITEAKAIVSYLKTNKVSEAFIITPFRNQSYLINEELKKANISEDIKCGTIHSIQGSEKDTIIMSTSLSLKSSKRTYEWVKKNEELLNVATTRAKKKFVLVADSEAINLQKDDNDDLNDLCEYVKSNGKYSLYNQTHQNNSIGLSNDSRFEDEFLKTITQFCSTTKGFSVKRNMKVKDVLNNVSGPILIAYFKKAEFDIVLYKKYGAVDIPAIAIEINGGEHIGKPNDAKKMEICKQNKLKYFSISNEHVKAYEYIKSIILSLVGEKYEQLSFDDME